ncbi:MAG: endoribonuclease MazF [Nitrospinae bacterium]|nr:endoribonuclease MazF [Nitrospinota bacterium]MCH7649989.1 endoribonuclease MazF [Nitrospinota bacterium]MCH8933299.1 endoribonuclease MazF [Nitrospinota bacterium]TDJ51686.1 MAG: endoribonuclease MazF [Nitrospina sp.]TDJ59999.1 MAG: endoribonuclease MazF [Nitrospina sp.]
MVARKKYVPDRGHIIWVDFTPQAGHEQAGHRPAMVLSPKIYNEKSGLAICCPITSKVKNYPFAVELSKKLGGGCVLADQVKSLDWRVRHAKLKSKASPKILTEVLEKLEILLFRETG